MLVMIRLKPDYRAPALKLDVEKNSFMNVSNIQKKYNIYK